MKSTSSLEKQYPRGTVIIDSVSKRFRKHTVTKRSYTTIKTSLVSQFFHKKFPRDNFLQALDNVSVTVPPGSAVGIIGRNGSGKSTLLKLISGIYRPDTGKVSVNGRISALIELGAGFHPDFTGRENIYLGGVMYGLSRKDIDQRFEAIVTYAGLADFIDDPVRTYSSGMYMRLGFSLAVHTDPDILLVDEVLAVGDAAFVHRCHETISELKRQGKTLILVTHDLDSVERWCNEAIWLERGIVREQGEPREVIDSYLRAIHAQEEKTLADENQDLGVQNIVTDHGEGKRWGSKEVEIVEVRLRDSSGEAKWLFYDEDRVTVEVEYRIARPIKELVFGVGILRADGVAVHGTNTNIENLPVPLPDLGRVEPSPQSPLHGTYRFEIKRLGLLEGSYFLDVACHMHDGSPYDYHHRLHKFSVRSSQRYHGIYVPEHSWTFLPNYPVLEPAEDEKIRKFAGRI